MVVGVIIAIVIIALLVYMGTRGGDTGTPDENATTTDTTTGASPVSLPLDLRAGVSTLGQAVLVEESGNTTVIIALTDIAVAHPAHIHTGICGSNGPIKYQLETIAGGTSETVLNGVTIASLLGVDTYLNVHKGASDLAEFACADVKGVVSAGQ